MTKYVITVEDELWERFKRTVTRDKTINEVIVELIRRMVGEVEARNKRSKRGS